MQDRSRPPSKRVIFCFEKTFKLASPKVSFDLLKKLLTICGLVLLTGCYGDSGSQPSNHPTMTAEDLFRLHCSTCHGDGSGNGHVAATLKLRPRNLMLEEWQKSVSDKHIYDTIRGGGTAVKLSPEMPAFGGKLDSDQMQELVDYIRTLGEV